MKKFERIKSYNKKYSDELIDSIRTILPKLIEAFTIIYGEKYRDYITYTLTNLNYVFFIPERLFKSVLINPIDCSKKTVYLANYYIKYLYYLKRKYNTLPKEQKQEFVIKNFIVSTTLNERDLQDETIIKALEIDYPLMSFIESNGNFKKTIFYPIYTIDFLVIIHEMNHALNLDAIMHDDKKLYTPRLFSNEASDEIVNDYIAAMVYTTYFEIGGVLPKPLKEFGLERVYQPYYSLAEYLFDSLEPLVLTSLIAKRHNLFINMVGKVRFQKLCKLLEYFFENGHDEEKQEEYKNLVDEMYEYVMSFEEVNYDAYYEELESKGYRVRKLK